MKKLMLALVASNLITIASAQDVTYLRKDTLDDFMTEHIFNFENYPEAPSRWYHSDHQVFRNNGLRERADGSSRATTKWSAQDIVRGRIVDSIFQKGSAKSGKVFLEMENDEGPVTLRCTYDLSLNHYESYEGLPDEQEKVDEVERRLGVRSSIIRRHYLYLENCKQMVDGRAIRLEHRRPDGGSFSWMTLERYDSDI